MLAWGMRTGLALLLSGLLIAPAAPPPTFSDDVWAANLPTYEAILRHPFLLEMRDGTLDPQIFAAYLAQDARYLNAFARALSALAAKAPREEWARRLRADALASLAEERALQHRLLESYGIDPAAVAATEPSADAFAYANFIVATAHDRSFAEGLAALLPCYWIYWEVGQVLAERGSPNSTYQAWIAAYAGADYAEAVRAFRAMVDEVAAGVDAGTRASMAELFGVGSRYEWMFWDAAYHRRGWPVR